MNCTHEELIDTLRPSLTPDVLHGGGFVRTAIAAATLGALVRVGAYEIADPLLGSAMSEAVAAGRRFDATAQAVTLTESLAMQGRILAAERLLAEIDFTDTDRFAQCGTVQPRWLAALRERPGLEPLTVTGHPQHDRPRAGRAIGFSSAMFITELIGRVQLLEGDHAGALANFDRLGSAAERHSVRNPSFVPWRAGRCAALAGLGRTKEGADAAEENLELSRAFGAPVTVADALACVARFRPPEARSCCSTKPSI